MSCQNSSPYIFVDGILALTMGPDSAQVYHSTLWRLGDPQVLSTQCRVYNGLFIIPCAAGVASSAPRITLAGHDYHIVDYIHTALGRTSRVLCQGVYRPKTVSTASQREGLLAPIFFTVGGRLGITLEDAARKNTNILDNAVFHAPMRNKSTGYLCIHWPGYQLHDAQVELKDSKRQPITIGKLAQRVANFIDTFVGDREKGAVEDRNSRSDDLWQWPQVTPYIRSRITLLGVAHVSTGHWQVLVSISGA
ncbi:unnamed protein product [Peniophora sp. CBMAI 1063]|nr:unnamed protein product [Peniophora sp. CBMAI 1063]